MNEEVDNLQNEGKWASAVNILFPKGYLNMPMTSYDKLQSPALASTRCHNDLSV